MLVWVLALGCRTDAVQHAKGPDVDASALAVFKRVDRTIASWKSIEGVCVRTLVNPDPNNPEAESRISTRIRFALARPNYARIESSLTYRERGSTEWKSIPRWRVDASDGTTISTFRPSSLEITSSPVSRSGSNIPVKDLVPLQSFFDAKATLLSTVEAYQSEDLLQSLKDLGVDSKSGMRTRKIRMVCTRVGSKETITSEYSIDSRSVIVCLEVRFGSSGRSARFDMFDVTLNGAVDPAQFAFKPPIGAHPPAQDRLEPQTVPIGSVAPDFHIKDSKGVMLKLSDFKGKVVVLDFWATWCGPCQDAFPGLQRLAKSKSRDGVVVLAVSVGDTERAFRKWLSEHAKYDSIRFALDPAGISGDGIDTRLFHAGALPTTFIVDRSGQIAARVVGYGEGTHRRIESAVEEALRH